jgi:hypothetical protein
MYFSVVVAAFFGPIPTLAAKALALNARQKGANDPSSATRRTGRNDCNRDAPAGALQRMVKPFNHINPVTNRTAAATYQRRLITEYRKSKFLRPDHPGDAGNRT